MKKLLQLCLVAALAFGTQAHAGYIDNSQTYSKSVVQDGTEGGFAFDRTVDTNAASLGSDTNGFADRYTFALAATSYFGGDMTSVLHPDGNGLVITGFSLHQANGDLLYSATRFDDASQWWIFTEETTLAKGSYFLQVDGYATAASATYSGNFNVSAVPEPGSLAMMLGGLAIVGAMVRRRN